MGVILIVLILGVLSVVMWLAGIVAGEKDVDYYRILHVLAAMSFSAATALLIWFLLSFR